MNFEYLRLFTKQAEGTEVSDSFTFWTGLFAISCVLGRSVYIDMGHYMIHPNLYIILVAGSGKLHKGASIGFLEALLPYIQPNLNLIGQDSSPEALINALIPKESSLDNPLPCVGCVIADELATFINRQSYERGMPAKLTSLYDNKSDFLKRTISRGAERLGDVSLCLLGASTVEFLRESFPPKAIGHGLTSRIIFVYEDKEKPPVILTDDFDKAVRYKLVEYLNKMRKLTGRIMLADITRTYLESSYKKFWHESSMYSDPILRAYASRRYGHVLKLAICFLCSTLPGSDEMILLPEHLQAAERLLEACEITLPHLMRLIMSTDKGSLIEYVYDIIRAKKQIARKELLLRVTHRIDDRELTEVINTLVQSGRITQKFQSGAIYYAVSSAGQLQQ